MSQVYRYHYQFLNSSQQKSYDLMDKNIRLCKKTFKLPISHANEITFIFESFLLDNPDVFYVNSFQYTKDLNKQIIIMSPDYSFSINEIKQYLKIIDKVLSSFNAYKNESDYEKVLIVHDEILKNVVYDDTFSPISHSIIGIINSRSAVCEGIAKYVKLALERLSIKSAVISGHAVNPAFGQGERESHAWNIVEVNGSWYHLDVTFDLTIKHNMNRYDYFLVSTEEISRDHTTVNKLPPSSHKLMDYYTTNGLALAKSTNLEQLITRKLKNNELVMQFKLLNVREGLDPKDKVLKVAKNQCQQVLSRSFSVEIRYNNAMWVFELEVTLEQ
jgi:hypothetical protein